MNKLEPYQKIINQMIVDINFFSSNGWVLGTSGGFSTKLDSDLIVVSQTHKDKSLMKPSDFILVDSQGNPKSDGTPSGETAYHLCVYNHIEDAKSVIHTHSIYGTLISELYDKKITFQDYEFLKGIDILNSLSSGIDIPIFSNLQQLNKNCELISSYLESYATIAFLLKKHGLFVWGNSWEQSKQHCEILEFLFQLTYLKKSRLN